VKCTAVLPERAIAGHHHTVALSACTAADIAVSVEHGATVRHDQCVSFAVIANLHPSGIAPDRSETCHDRCVGLAPVAATHIAFSAEHRSTVTDHQAAVSSAIAHPD